MKKHIYFKFILVVLTLVWFSTYAQVKTKVFDKGVPSALLPANEAPRNQRIIVAPGEFNNLRTQADSGANNDYKYRFALPVSVDIDVLSASRVVENDGFIIYALSVTAQNARNISLQFSEFYLSSRAVLSLFTTHELTDSITAKQNNQN